MRVAIVDSGIDPHNPYVGGVAGGVSFTGDSWHDAIGHGTAVAATFRELAPFAELFAVRVFDLELRADAALLAKALDWCAANRMDLASFSIGTQNPAHELLLREAVQRALAQGMIIVAAEGYLPGGLPGVITAGGDEPARPLPGMPYARGLHGVSFAVARRAGELANTPQTQLPDGAL